MFPFTVADSWGYFFASKPAAGICKLPCTSSNYLKMSNLIGPVDPDEEDAAIFFRRQFGRQLLVECPGHAAEECRERKDDERRFQAGYQKPPVAVR